MATDKQIELTFPRLNQFWQDSGVLGLYRIILDKTHAQPALDSRIESGNLAKRHHVTVDLDASGLHLRGQADKVKKLLEEAYDRLVDAYYNISTEKQISDKAKYNFYYDSKKDKFISFPKRNSVGIASLIFNKKLSPSVTSVNWVGQAKKEIQISGKKVKKTRAVLPESHKHLQRRMDSFLDENQLDITTAGLLVDGPNMVKPQLPKIAIIEKSGKNDTCFLCGTPSSSTQKVNQTVFPLITGEAGILSFFSEGKSPAKVCWRCAYVGKFVPVNGFFERADQLKMFFPFAPSLNKMNQVYDELVPLIYRDPNHYRNFKHDLGGYFQHTVETAFAFLHSVYAELKPRLQNKSDSDFFKDIFHLCLEDAPLAFAIIAAQKKGNTWLITEVWPFDDTVYLFRLLYRLEKEDVKVKDLMKALVDHDAAKAPNRSLLRNRVIQSIFHKRSVLDDLVAFAYHVNKNERNYIAPLLDFAQIYEIILNEENEMDKKARDAAVDLGKRIGASIANDREKSRGRGKGRLFALRKMRTLPDFLNELNSLLFQYQIAVPPATYEGALDDDNFEWFKGFCLLAALNTYNAFTADDKKNKGGKS